MYSFFSKFEKKYPNLFWFSVMIGIITILVKCWLVILAGLFFGLLVIAHACVTTKPDLESFKSMILAEEKEARNKDTHLVQGWMKNFILKKGLKYLFEQPGVLQISDRIFFKVIHIHITNDIGATKKLLFVGVFNHWYKLDYHYWAGGEWQKTFDSEEE